MKADLQVLLPPRLSSYQFFLQDFSEACSRAGFLTKPGLALPWKIRLAVAKLKLSRRLPQPFCSRSRLVVPCGGYPDSFAFPFGYAHEIIPVLWDTWPRYHARLIASFKRHRVRLAFFTQRQVGEWVREQLPGVKCVWLPEAVKADGYKKGNALAERSINVLELGRLMPSFHNAVVGKVERHLFKDPKRGLLFPDFDSLTDGLADAKITVCYPRCDTHPEMAGGIETLTQRYWECMLSRTLIVGRAPRELVDFCGYDPVVEVGDQDPLSCVRGLLSHIEQHQTLVDRNYEFALKHADWANRMDIVRDAVFSNPT